MKKPSFVESLHSGAPNPLKQSKLFFTSSLPSTSLGQTTQALNLSTSATTSTSKLPNGPNASVNANKAIRKLNGPDRPSKRVKISKPKSQIKSKVLAKLDLPEEADDDNTEMDLKLKVNKYKPWRANATFQETGENLEETEELSDTDGPSFRQMLDSNAEEQSETQETPSEDLVTIDPSIPDDLLAILDLQNSPNKKHRQTKVRKRIQSYVNYYKKE